MADTGQVAMLQWPQEPEPVYSTHAEFAGAPGRAGSRGPPRTGLRAARRAPPPQRRRRAGCLPRGPRRRAPPPRRVVPRALAAAGAACPNSNFLKGVKWSPDGACCLTASEDKWCGRASAAAPRPAPAVPSACSEQHHSHSPQPPLAALPHTTPLCRRPPPPPPPPHPPPPPAPPPKRLRVFDLPRDALERASEAAPSSSADSLASGLRVHAGELVYDYNWYSGMSTADPASCCFASTARVSACFLGG
jgi:hypothetical protein